MTSFDDEENISELLIPRIKLPPISDEQKEIIEAIKKNNVVVDSVAGSGKTTTALYIAKNLPEEKILLLTYNRKLRLETEKKCKELLITNMEVYTYHAFCVRYFNGRCCKDGGIRTYLNANQGNFPEEYNKLLNTDNENVELNEEESIVKKFNESSSNEFLLNSESSSASFNESSFNDDSHLRSSGFDDDEYVDEHIAKTINNKYKENKLSKKIVKEKTAPKQPKGVNYSNKYDVIIIDEAQDITPLYYRLIRYILDKNENKSNVRLCIIGDRFQSIFKFNEADERFIIYAKNIFKINDIPFVELKLSTTYRCTKPMIDFVNACVLNENRLKASVDNLKSTAPNKTKRVRYCILNTFVRGCFKGTTTFIILAYLKMYKPEDIFILAPSVKSDKSPVKQLANSLSNMKISLYVSKNDEEKIDEDIIKGKLVITTFHQAKGLERKFVFIFGFDDTYFTYYDKGCNKHLCPNTVYVAITRATEELVIFHHRDNPFFRFINIPNLLKVCSVDGFNTLTHKVPLSEGLVEKNDVSVSDLLNYIPSIVVNGALKFINVEEVKPSSATIKLTKKVENTITSMKETVADINGIFIPAYYEFISKGKMSIIEYIKKQTKRRLESKQNKLKNINDEIFERMKTTYIDLKRNGIANIEELLKSNKILTTEQEKHAMKTIENLLFITTVFNAIKEGFNFKLNQLGNFNWLNVDSITDCITRMRQHISKYAKYEVMIYAGAEYELQGKTVYGFIDAIDTVNTIMMTDDKKQNDPLTFLYGNIIDITEDNIDDVIETNLKNINKNKNTVKSAMSKTKEYSSKIIYEFKCVDELKEEHILQLAIYSYLYELNLYNLLGDEEYEKFPDNKYYLFNIVKDQIVEVKAKGITKLQRLENLRLMMRLLIHKKYYADKNKQPDIEWVSAIESTLK